MNCGYGVSVGVCEKMQDGEGESVRVYCVNIGFGKHSNPFILTTFWCDTLYLSTYLFISLFIEMF